MTPLEVGSDFIFRWEDGKQTDPNKTHSLVANDNGNWSGGKKGDGDLIGSNHGITPMALALHRGVPVSHITRAIMHSLTLTEAAQIALINYYQKPGLDKLPFNRVTASLWDFGYGAGQQTAIMQLQRTMNVPVNGHIDVTTIKAFTTFCVDEVKAAVVWSNTRLHHYNNVVAANPHDKEFLACWTERTKYFMPNNLEGWWHRFDTTH